MRREEMSAEALKCREQARHFDRPERELLLNIARAFEEMAARSEERSALEALRCW